MVGDVGDVGDVGNVGRTGGGGGAPVLPDRVDFPFIAQDVKVWSGGVWGPASPARALKDVYVTPKAGAWDYDAWGANWWAWQVLIAFSAVPNWHAMPGAPGPSSSPGTLPEFQALIIAAEDERADALGEIVAQHNDYTDFAAYFMTLLRMTPASHPATYRLLHIAGLVGIFVSMHWKMQSKRARPSEVLPALMPPVPVPGHPSYPSGHATQAFLMALVVREAMIKPAIAPSTTPIMTVHDEWAPLLDTLAWRIARNREIAGVHYRTDTEAGTQLAVATLAILRNDTAMSTITGVSPFRTTLTRARGEW